MNILFYYFYFLPINPKLLLLPTTTNVNFALLQNKKKYLNHLFKITILISDIFMHARIKYIS